MSLYYHIRQRGEITRGVVSDVCVCVCVCRRHDKVIVLSEFGELVDSQIPQERGDQSCVSPTTIHSAECKI